jgi:hypothetical protein
LLLPHSDPSWDRLARARDAVFFRLPMTVRAVLLRHAGEFGLVLQAVDALRDATRVGECGISKDSWAVKIRMPMQTLHDADDAQLERILAHELGHAFAFASGNPGYLDEAVADALARAWGFPRPG